MKDTLDRLRRPRRPGRHRSRWAMLPVRTRLVIIGAVPVVLVALLLGWNLLGASSDGPSNRASGLEETPNLAVTKPTEDPEQTSAGLGNLPDAFAAAGKNDITNGGLPILNDNKVTITLQSDGQMYFGYLFRSGPGNVSFANNTYTASYTVVGGKPFALAAVQAMQGTSYVTCTISINGRLAAQTTARGAGEIAGCRY